MNEHEILEYINTVIKNDKKNGKNKAKMYIAWLKDNFKINYKKYDYFMEVINNDKKLQ